MSRITTTTIQVAGSIDVIPSGYTGNTSLTAGTGNYVPANGYHSHTSTSNYARWTLSASNTSTVCYVYYTFDTSAVPANATITSVTAQVKAYRNNRVTQSTCGVQLYANTTAKGTANVGNLGTSATTVSITDGGSWTRSDLTDLRLRIYGRRSNTNNTGYLYFYGATITIEYTVPQEVQTIEYQISVTNNSSVTVSPTGTNNWVAEGGSQTISFSNVSDLATLGVIDNSTNVTSQLVHTSGNNYTYTIEDIDADHTIVVSNVTAYNITASVDSSATGLATVSPTSGRAGQGSDYELEITSDDYDTIRVYDGNTDVTSQLTIGKELVEQDPASAVPSNYEGTLTQYSTSYPITNGYYGIDHTSYARFDSNTTLRYGMYLFENLDIPIDATIVSVACQVRIRCYNGSSYASVKTLQMYSGTTAKGTASTMPDSATTVTVNCGEWTAEELANCGIRFDLQGNGSGTARVYFYGANITVTYKEYEDSDTIKVYTIHNVQAAHNVTVQEAPYLLISGTSSLSGASFSNLPKKIYTSGSSFTVQLSGISNVHSFRLSDNNIDKTSQVNTSTWQYSISNITVDHVLEITEAPKYYIQKMSAMAPVWDFGETGITYVYEGDTYVVTLTGITNPYSFVLTDIGNDGPVDVTSLVDTTNWTYTIYNVNYRHILTLAQADYYAVTGTSNFTGVGFSGLSNQVYKGDTITVTLTGITNANSFSLFDNDVNVTNEVNISNYQYVIESISEDHALRIEENNYYSVSGSSSFSGVTMSGMSNKVYEGQSLTITISGASNIHSLHLLDNDVDVSEDIEQSGNNFIYAIPFVIENHTLALSEADHHSVTASSSHATADISVSPATMYPGEGFVADIEIDEGTNPYSIKLLDNNEDVTHLIEYVTASASTYEVETASGASYGFTFNSGTGYYVSSNTGVDKSAAVCVVTFNLAVQSRITFKFINYAEESYDFGVFGNIDGTLSNDYYAAGSGGATITDSNYKLACNTSTYNSSSEQTLVYDNVSAGEHYIYVKFSKDDASASNNDSLQFKIDSIEDLEENVSSIRYSRSSVNEDHVLLLTTEQTCSMTKVENYQGATISFSNSSPYRYEPITITLNVSDISLVTVMASALSTNRAITGKFVEVSSGTYRMTYSPKGDTVITVSQHIDYTITATDYSDNGTLTPVGTITIEAGYDQYFSIITDYPNRIYLKDNDVIVNEYFQHVDALPSTSDTFAPNEFDYENSFYDFTYGDNGNGIYSTNVIANGLTEYTSTTRCALYAAQGSGTVSYMYYNFDCSGIPEYASISSVSCQVKAGTQGSQYYSTYSLQLATGTTLKGSSVTPTGTNASPSTHTINGGSWTRAELDDAKIKFSVTRGSSNTTTGATFSFYGATLSVSYFIDEHYSYTLETVTGNHTVTLEDRPRFSVRSNSFVDGVSIDPAQVLVYEGNDVSLEIDAVNMAMLRLLDNGVDVTNYITGTIGNYVYTIENVMFPHSLNLGYKTLVYAKVDGSWVKFTRAYVKANGSWVRQESIDNLFSYQNIYVNLVGT